VTLSSTAIRTAIVISALLSASSAHAECFTLDAQFVMQEKVFELVFSGTVVDVVRTEIPRFEKGRHYVALARRMDAVLARQGVGLGGSDTVAFTPAHCSESLAPDIARDLGPGRPPG
jgi:hypothetical protein